MSYKDMTFCREKTCAHFGPQCHRSLTNKVLGEAEVWWGGPGAPISVYADRPECFLEKDDAVLESETMDSVCSDPNSSSGGSS